MPFGATLGEVRILVAQSLRVSGRLQAANQSLKAQLLLLPQGDRGRQGSPGYRFDQKQLIFW